MSLMRLALRLMNGLIGHGVLSKSLGNESISILRMAHHFWYSQAQ
jgi:hypothetical protein